MPLLQLIQKAAVLNEGADMLQDLGNQRIDLRYGQKKNADLRKQFHNQKADIRVWQQQKFEVRPTQNQRLDIRHEHQQKQEIRPDVNGKLDKGQGKNKKVDLHQEPPRSKIGKSHPKLKTAENFNKQQGNEQEKPPPLINGTSNDSIDRISSGYKIICSCLVEFHLFLILII